MTDKIEIVKPGEFDLRGKLTYILQKKNQTLHQVYPDYLLEFKTENFPIDVRYLKPGFETYILELGCGWGEFAIEYALSSSSTFYVAMDKKRYRIKKCVKNQDRFVKQGESLKNLNWMVCNFDWIFSELFKKKSFDKIIINFPDPWPKKRHQKHRFVTRDFIEKLEKLIIPGGIVEFATDHWSYMESAITDFMEDGRWANANGENKILSYIPDRPVSFFENLKRAENENIYFIQLKKSFA